MRRNPLADSDDLAQKLYDSMPFPLASAEIPLSKVNLSTADRGHPVVDEPERYRWFLIPKFPVNAFGLRLEDLMRDSGYPGHEKQRHDKIVDLLRAGPAWPAVVAADGVLVDGFHRVTANRTLGRRFMPVVVAVDSSSHDYWNEMWLEDAMRTNPPFAGFSELARHYYGQGLSVPQVVAKINERASRPVSVSHVLAALRAAGYHVPPERMEPPHRMNARRRNTDEELRFLERAVKAEPSPTNVILLARAYERSGKAPELWLVIESPIATPRSLWPSEAEAKQEAARLYVASLREGSDSPLEVYDEEDAEYPDESDTSGPVTRQEIFDAWDSLDVERVIARSKVYVRRSTREKWQWGYEVHGPILVGKDGRAD